MEIWKLPSCQSLEGPIFSQMLHMAEQYCFLYLFDFFSFDPLMKCPLSCATLFITQYVNKITKKSILFSYLH